jgi:MFS family permease
MIETTVQSQNDSSAAASGIWGPAHRQLTAGLILTITAAAFESLAVATTLPATAKDLGGLTLYGWVFSAFMLSNLVGIMLAGAEADRHGPARPFLLAVALFTVGLGLSGAAPSMPVLIFGRAVQGLGAGGISTVAYVAIGRGYPEATRPRMLALMSSAWVIPGLVGPALAGLVVDNLGWRWVFLGLIPLPLLALALAAPALARLAPTTPGAPDWQRPLAALRLASGTGLVMAGLEQSWLVLAALLIGLGGLLAIPALGQLLPAGTFRLRRGLPAAIASAGLLNLAFFGVDAFVPLQLTNVRGQTATAAGIALTAATIGWSGSAWVQARIVGRFSRRAITLAGLLLIGLAIAGVSVALSPSTPVELVTVAWAVAGIGMGLSYSTITLVVLESAEPGQEGAATSAMQLANVLSIALGTGLGGVLVAQATARAGSPSPGLIGQNALMLGVLVLALITALRLPGRAAQRSAAAGEPV